VIGRRLRHAKAPAAAPTAAGSERRRIATSPQVVLPAFGFVLALVYAVGAGFGPTVSAPPTLPAVAAGVADTVVREVRYVVVDEQGLERPAFADAVLARDLADDPAARLNAALAALHADRVEEDAWPASVAAPTAFVFEIDRRRVAVVDVGRPAPEDGVTVAQEWAAVRSLVATARAEVDADVVRITVAGAPADALWGHVAVPSDTP
jgi:hypothetical protein